MSDNNATLPILLVEDNPDNRQLAMWMLEDAGFEVVEAETAEIGLEQLEKSRYAIILMDISLPGIDGKEATRIIRQNPDYGQMPIIALTAHAIQEEIESIMASGVNTIVNKPVDEDELLTAIHSLT